MDNSQLVLILIPVAIIQLILMVTALIYLFRAHAVRGNKWMWVAIIVLLNIVGPILFFAFGRKDT
ncbi:PLD nuclease N-terminal domain-containing protein [Cohnella terricola]|uniref:Transcriptional regulator n=1 Tax=Cohnella terricola TaxID=1289167 RepID=A0A559J6G1_9BACL|nr:PLD nuclease N-terminal domain-containing protein [Cohnella terricola]TVX95457.1 transcriptional regulator [Cohnella terricola]